MQIYKVGGAVRDRLLGKPVTDIDWVVVGATAKQMLSMGFRPVGSDFPVFLHPKTGDEYALARTERKSGQGYGGFIFHASPDVTLEEDLIRRDLTINAMAEDEAGNVTDPYNGLRDLEERILRHVSPAFAEDPLRVLRVARFAARYASLGFSIAPETLELMRQLSRSGELQALTPERCWKEISRALMEDQPQVFIEVLRRCDALEVLLPEVNALFGVPQPPAHHPEIDSGAHTLSVLEQSALHKQPLTVRWACLLHDLGKGLTPEKDWPRHIAHEHKGLRLIKAVNDRYKVPRDCQELAVLVASTTPTAIALLSSRRRRYWSYCSALTYTVARSDSRNLSRHARWTPEGAWGWKIDHTRKLTTCAAQLEPHWPWPCNHCWSRASKAPNWVRH